jgi:hypothetical protein
VFPRLTLNTRLTPYTNTRLRYDSPAFARLLLECGADPDLTPDLGCGGTWREGGRVWGQKGGVGSSFPIYIVNISDLLIICPVLIIIPYIYFNASPAPSICNGLCQAS